MPENNDQKLPLYRPLVSYYEEFREEVMTRGENPKLPLQTLPKLNRKLWGLKPGMTVIGARTSIGKTSFALQLAYDLASQGIPTLFLSLEMTVGELVERLFCNIYKVDNYTLQIGGAAKSPEIQQQLQDFQAHLATMPLLITEGIGFTFEQVNEIIEQQPSLQVVFVDYIQTIRQVGNEREMMNEYLRRFREICLRRGIAGVVCSQVNRVAMLEKTKKEPDEPGLEHLKGSGTIEEGADLVILLHWPWLYKKDKTDISKRNIYSVRIAKNRKGRTGKHEVNFYPEFYRFEDMPDDDTLTVADVERLMDVEQKLDLDSPEK